MVCVNRSDYRKTRYLTIFCDLQGLVQTDETSLRLLKFQMFDFSVKNGKDEKRWEMNIRTSLHSKFSAYENNNGDIHGQQVNSTCSFSALEKDKYRLISSCFSHKYLSDLVSLKPCHRYSLFLSQDMLWKLQTVNGIFGYKKQIYCNPHYSNGWIWN